AATGSGGLAPLHASRGTFIAYATEPNRVAYDGIDDDHSPFTRALLDHIETPGLEIATLMKRVRNDVFQTTQQRQVPWEESSLFSDFFFIPESASEPAVSEPRVADLAPEQAAPEGEITPPRPEHPPEAPPLLNPLEVSNKATQAQLAMVPQIRDPNGDQLWVQILELPTRGAVRVNRKQVKIADRMTLDQLMSGYYYPGRSPPVGPAGKIGFQVYDQQFAVDTGLPIVIVKENEPPVFDIQELVVATLGRGPQGLNIKPPTDPDGDSVFVTIAALPRAGKLMMRGLPLDVGVSVTTDQIAELRYVPPDRFVDDPGVMKLEAHDGSHSVLKTIKLALNRNPIMTARSARAQHRRSRAGSAAFSLDLEVPKDPDGDPLKIRIFGLPDNGDILVGADSKAIEMRALLSPEETGGLMFRPKSEGRSHLTLEITDGRGGYFRRRVELIVGPANRSPRLTRPEIQLVAMAGETMPLSLDKPVDPDGDSLSVQIVSVPENGEVLSAGEIVRLGNVLTAEQLAKLQFRASPSADAEPAELRFVVFDAYGAATDGLVEIAVNHAPTGERVTKAVLAGGPPIDVVPIAPFDADGDALEIRVQSIPVVGRIMVNERVIAFGDRLTIDDLMIARFEPPSSGFFGPVGTFDYLIDDGRGGTATGSTTIIINSPPAVQANPRFEFDLVNGRSQPLAIPPPFDREGDPLEIVVVALPTQGSLTAGDRTLVAGDVLTVGELRSLRITIAPTELNAGAAGAFVYTVRDAQGAEAEGSIDIAVRAPNQQPTAPSFDVTVQVAGGPVALFGDQTRQPVDPDDDELTVIIIDAPWSGDVDLNGRPLSSGSRISAADMANILYWPGEDAGLAGAFVYVAEDERSRSAEGVVTITLNRPPMIAGRVGFGAKAPLPAGEGRAPLFKQDPAAEAGLLPLPTDDLGDVLEIEIVRMTDKPGLTLWLDEAPIGSGEIVRGADSFARIEIQAAEAAIGEQIDLEFVIRDSAGAASTVTLAVSVVAAPNVAPIFLNQGLRTVMENEGPQDLDLTPPTDSDPLRVFLTDVPQHGSLMLAGEAIEPGHLMSTEEIRQLQFDPGSAGPGIAGTIILTAVDDKGASGDGQFIIRIEERPNRPPILPDQPDADMVIGVGQLRLPLKPPVDPDDDPLTIRISAVPQNGELRFGDRPAEVGMLLAADDFNSAYFTPHQDRPLVRGGQSFLDFSVSDGRGEGIDGKVRISTRLHDCDRLASTADNFDSVSKEGVLFEQLDSAQAIPACEQALRDYGEIERFRFQLARAQHAGADIEDAWQNYSLAAQSGDIAAQYNLAMLLLDDDLSAVLDQETGDVDGLVSALDLLRTACEADWTTAQPSFAAVVVNRPSALPNDMTRHYAPAAMRCL
ncbi:MAG: caspase family protein, partial [Geminicoccaceae bacterium]